MRLFTLLPIAALAACAPEGLLGGDQDAEYAVVADVPPAPNPQLDLLFVVDNSHNMLQRQRELGMSFQRLVSHLEFVRGGLPSLHVAVTSTDLGVGPFTGEANCTSDGDAGRLLVPEGGTRDGARFLRHLRDPNGGYDTNYAGDLVEAFASMAELGESGCEYEQPLAAMERALSEHPESYEFLRPDAVLAVLILTDEDDCSAIDDRLFDPDNPDFAYNSPNFRCFAEGVRCDGDDVYLPGRRQGCEPKTNSAYVARVASYVDFLRQLKADPRDVVVTGLIGDSRLVEIETEMDGSPQLAPSCETGEGPAYPAVRLQAFVDRFRSGGEVASLCESDRALDQLTQTARQIRRAIGTRCLDGYIRDMDLDTPGRQPECRVYEVVGEKERRIAACSPTNDPEQWSFPCYTLLTGPEECGDFPTQLALDVHTRRSSDGEAYWEPSLDTGARIRAECVVDEAP